MLPFRHNEYLLEPKHYILYPADEGISQYTFYYFASPDKYGSGETGHFKAKGHSIYFASFSAIRFG